MKIAIGKYDIHAGFTSLQPWTHMKLHRYDYYFHFVFGRFSLCVTDGDYPAHEVCTACHGEVEYLGEDSLTVCDGCQSIEAPTTYISNRQWDSLG